MATFCGKSCREMPSSLREMIRIADSYALGDPTQPLYNSSEPSKRHPGNNATASARRNDRQDYGNKRREDQTDHRYGTHQVAAVDVEQQGAGYSQKPRYDEPTWNQNQNQDNRRKAPDQSRPQRIGSLMRRCWIVCARTTPPTPEGR